MNSHVYFTLIGNDFDPNILTNQLNLSPNNSWRKGDKGKYNPNLKYSCWEYGTNEEIEGIWMDKAVDKIISKLNSKIEVINKLKKDYNLKSVLRIIMYIDMNEENSTPALGHSLVTIKFLYESSTTTDVDIYRFDSSNDKT